MFTAIEKQKIEAEDNAKKARIASEQAKTAQTQAEEAEKKTQTEYHRTDFTEIYFRNKEGSWLFNQTTKNATLYLGSVCYLKNLLL